MRRFIILTLLVAFCLSLSGCWFFDAEHNRRYWNNMKHDLYLMLYYPDQFPPAQL